MEAYSDRIMLCSWPSQALLPELTVLASALPRDTQVVFAAQLPPMPPSPSPL